MGIGIVEALAVAYRAERQTTAALNELIARLSTAATLYSRTSSSTVAAEAEASLDGADAESERAAAERSERAAFRQAVEESAGPEPLLRIVQLLAGQEALEDELAKERAVSAEAIDELSALRAEMDRVHAANAGAYALREDVERAETLIQDTLQEVTLDTTACRTASGMAHSERVRQLCDQYELIKKENAHVKATLEESLVDLTFTKTENMTLGQKIRMLIDECHEAKRVMTETKDELAQTQGELDTIVALLGETLANVGDLNREKGTALEQVRDLVQRYRTACLGLDEASEASRKLCSQLQSVTMDLDSLVLPSAALFLVASMMFMHTTNSSR